MKLNNIGYLFRILGRWFTVPQSAPEMNRNNFLNVQIDAIGVGLANAANPFLFVLLTRLGATTLQVGLLTTMPAITGMVLAIPLGQFLQSRRNIVPWFSMARLTVLSGYALTALVTLLFPKSLQITSILVIWALATIPQTILSICFTVVMNSVAGPAGRYELMTHRWSILGFTNAFASLIAGQILDRLAFPLNYEVVFFTFSAGGLISFYFSSQINLKDQLIHDAVPKTHSIRALANNNLRLVIKEKPFIVFISKRFVFLLGTALITPLLPIYYVRELKAADSSIALINIAANVSVILGYFLWTAQSRIRGNRQVILATTCGAALFPIMVGLTHQVWPVPIYSAIFGIFNAGLSLVLFDELMKCVPIEYSAIFVAVAQTMQFLSSIIGPMIGTALSGLLGLSPALILGGVISLAGFALFLFEGSRATQEATAAVEPTESGE